MPQRSSSVTISDVAREAGVSKTTASFVLADRPGIQLSPSTRQRVRDTARRLGYRRSGIATALSVGRIYTVGLLLQVNPDSRDIGTISAYAKDVIVALTCACSRADLRLTTILKPRDDTDAPTTSPEAAANELADGRVDGLVVSSLSDDALARALYATGFPVVSIGSGYAERRIAIDNVGGGRVATEHLLTLGHRRIGYVTYADRRALSLSSVERQCGYEEALRSAGVAPQILSLEQAIANLDRPPSERCTAFFCLHDYITEPLLSEARQRGLRVPQDLSLVGFDNSIVARLAYPTLTSVDNPLDAQADVAVATLLALWRGESPSPAFDRLPTHLVVRESTAPPNPENQL